MFKWLLIFLLGGTSALVAGVLFYTSITAYERTDHAPIIESPFVPVPENVESNTIVFVGDIMLARDVENTMRVHGAAYPYTHTETYLDAPYVVGNFEASIPRVHIPTPSMTMRFSVDPIFIPALSKAGFTHLSLANNHAFDYGTEGYLGARDALYASGVEPFGHPYEFATTSTSYITLKDHTVAIVGIYAVVANPSAATLATYLESVRAQSDLQIAYIHWGNEYELVHSGSQEALARSLVAEGVDLIIGHHPHVVQDVAVYEGVPVLYSLGNFIFDQYFSTDVQTGLVVGLDIEASEAAFLTLTPVSSINSRVSPRILTGYERTEFLKSLGARSDASLFKSIEEGVIPVRFHKNELRMTDISI